MTIMPFQSRACPTCSARNTVEEVKSAQRAERMGLDQIRPYWSGLFKEKVFFSYDRCQNCGLLFCESFFTDYQLSELYAEMAPNMEDIPSEALNATQRGYFEIARKSASMDGGYLEIGPDVGYVVRLAAEQGQFGHFWLFEPNRAVHAILSNATCGHPNTISADMTDLSAVPDGSIGLALMIHVLDHLLDPISMLRQIRAKLKPSGALVIVTHNEASLLRRIMGVRWPPFCLQHPQLFNPASIRKMLEEAGYGKASVARSQNYFPISFMVRQAAYAAGFNLGNVVLPSFPIGLKLGNIITLARA